MAGESQGAEALRFRCTGHPNLRASHHKTLELTREREISPRATCVVGVGATYDPRRVARLKGPLRLEIEAGGRREVLRAIATPFMAVSDSLVFRRSDQRLGKTFAYAADRSARDLDRSFVAALGDPRTELLVTLREDPEILRPTVRSSGSLMILLEGLSGELSSAAGSYLEAADLLVADTVPKQWAEGSQGLLERTVCRGEEDASRIVSRLEEGTRAVLATAVEELHPNSAALRLIHRAAEAEVPMTCIGEAPSWLRALALSGFPGVPAALREPSPAVATWRQDLASPALRRGTLVLPSAPQEVPKRLISLAEADQGRVFVLRDPGGRGEEGWRGEARALAETLRPRRGDRAEWYIVAGPQAVRQPEEGGSLPRSLLRRLLRVGVPLKSLAEAASPDFGGSYRKAYRSLLELHKTLRGADDEDPGR